MMKHPKQILIVLILIFCSNKMALAQTAGINYQALILNSEEIQIPGADVEENQVPLGLEEVSFRFSITDEEFQDLYSEEQTTTTDENGMVSLIVGDGTPLFSTFEDIVWNGTLKYLNVEIDIHSQNQGYVFLDLQKILYLPQSGTGATVDVADNLSNIPITDNESGDIIWVADVDGTGLSSLMVWDGNQWQLAQMNYDPTNELGLVVALNNADRDLQYSAPTPGDQVWNLSCECIQVYDGTSWVNINALDAIAASNGVNIATNNTIKLGGQLDEPTILATDATNTLSVTGLEESTSTLDTNVMTVNTSSGVITRSSLANLFQEEVTLTIAANDGQSQFATPLPIASPSKVNVYRNGVRIGFTLLNTTQVELEPEAICYAGDEIRIVQFTN